MYAVKRYEDGVIKYDDGPSVIKGGRHWIAVSEHRRKADAIAAADAVDHRAVVCDRTFPYSVIYDNGKPARLMDIYRDCV